MSTSSDPARPDPSDPAPVLSPCIGVCELDAAGYCVGCRRSIDEIATWSELDDAARQRIMTQLLPHRSAAHPIP